MLDEALAAGAGEPNDPRGLLVRSRVLDDHFEPQPLSHVDGLDLEPGHVLERRDDLRFRCRARPGDMEADDEGSGREGPFVGREGDPRSHVRSGDKLGPDEDLLSGRERAEGDAHRAHVRLDRDRASNRKAPDRDEARGGDDLSSGGDSPRREASLPDLDEARPWPHALLVLRNVERGRAALRALP